MHRWTGGHTTHTQRHKHTGILTDTKIDTGQTEDTHTHIQYL